MRVIQFLTVESLVKAYHTHSVPASRLGLDAGEKMTVLSTFLKSPLNFLFNDIYYKIR